MSSISSLVGSGSSSSFIDSMLGTSSSSSTSTTSSLSLTDYSLIKSGAYKKLMKAYYAEQSSSDSSNGDTKAEMTTTKAAAQDLAKATNALAKASYDEDDRDELLESLKSYVESYNSLIESTDDINDTTVLRNTLWITQQTSANEDLLSKVGITVNSDNTLEVDEDAFNSASLSDLKVLFSGTASYGSNVIQKAASVYSAAASALNATTTGSAYTSSGTYTSITTGSIIDSIT